MLYGWIDLIRRLFGGSHDFVSVDARRLSGAPHNSAVPRDFEMITRPSYALKSSENRVAIVSEEEDTILEMFPSSKTEFYSQEKKYASPSLSFSTPRPPSADRRNSIVRSPSVTAGRPQVAVLPTRQSSLARSAGREWDPADTHAKSSRRNNSGFVKL